MPLATLKYPRSLARDGIKFEKDKPHPVTQSLASVLKSDPRFTISEMSGGTDSVSAQMMASVEGGRPHIRAVRLEAIRVANGVLDPDVTENYEPNGLPSIGGLERLMGWRPDEGEIKEALKPGRRSAGILGPDGDVATARGATIGANDTVLTVSESGAHFVYRPPELTDEQLETLDTIVASKLSIVDPKAGKPSNIRIKGSKRAAPVETEVDPTTEGSVELSAS